MSDHEFARTIRMLIVTGGIVLPIIFTIMFCGDDIIGIIRLLLGLPETSEPIISRLPSDPMRRIPMCHKCGRNLKRCTAYFVKSASYDRETPHNAEWYCDNSDHLHVFYYAAHEDWIGPDGGKPEPIHDDSIDGCTM